MSDRTWEDIGNEIRDDYLRDGGPENVRFRGVQWEVWIAEVERAAAEKAWWEACLRIADGENHLDIAHVYQKQNPYLGAALGLTAGQEGENA